MLKRLHALIKGRGDTHTRAAAQLTEPEVINLNQARDAQKSGAQMVDVRERNEWDAGHIVGALLYPVSRIASDPDLDMGHDTPIVTYCRAGARAERAVEILRAAGYTDVCAMSGGFDDWHTAGYPTE